MAVVVDPDVRRLQVSMDDAARVRVLEGAGDVRGDLDGARHLEMSAGRGEQALDVAARHVDADDEGVAVVLAGIEDGDDVSVVAELAHRLGLSARTGLDGGTDPGRVVERQCDLGPAGRVGRQIDPLASPLAEEPPHPVAARDLGRDVIGKRLGRGRLGRSLRSEQIGSTGVAEPRAFTILVPTGRTPHARPSKPAARRALIFRAAGRHRLPGEGRRERRCSDAGRLAQSGWRWRSPW